MPEKVETLERYLYGPKPGAKKPGPPKEEPQDIDSHINNMLLKRAKARKAEKQNETGNNIS